MDEEPVYQEQYLHDLRREPNKYRQRTESVDTNKESGIGSDAESITGEVGATPMTIHRAEDNQEQLVEYPFCTENGEHQPSPEGQRKNIHLGLLPHETARRRDDSNHYPMTTSTRSKSSAMSSDSNQTNRSGQRRLPSVPVGDSELTEQNLAKYDDCFAISSAQLQQPELTVDGMSDSGLEIDQLGAEHLENSRMMTGQGIRFSEQTSQRQLQQFNDGKPVSELQRSSGSADEYWQHSIVERLSMNDDNDIRLNSSTAARSQSRKFRPTDAGTAISDRGSRTNKRSSSVVDNKINHLTSNYEGDDEDNGSSGRINARKSTIDAARSISYGARADCSEFDAKFLQFNPAHHISSNVIQTSDKGSSSRMSTDARAQSIFRRQKSCDATVHDVDSMKRHEYLPPGLNGDSYQRQKTSNVSLLPCSQNASPFDSQRSLPLRFQTFLGDSSTSRQIPEDRFTCGLATPDVQFSSGNIQNQRYHSEVLTKPAFTGHRRELPQTPQTPSKPSDYGQRWQQGFTTPHSVQTPDKPVMPLSGGQNVYLGYHGNADHYRCENDGDEKYKQQLRQMQQKMFMQPRALVTPSRWHQQSPARFADTRMDRSPHHSTATQSAGRLPVRTKRSSSVPVPDFERSVVETENSSWFTANSHFNESKTVDNCCNSPVSPFTHRQDVERAAMRSVPTEGASAQPVIKGHVKSKENGHCNGDSSVLLQTKSPEKVSPVRRLFNSPNKENLSQFVPNAAVSTSPSGNAVFHSNSSLANPVTRPPPYMFSRPSLSSSTDVNGGMLDQCQLPVNQQQPPKHQRSSSAVHQTRPNSTTPSKVEPLASSPAVFNQHSLPRHFESPRVQQFPGRDLQYSHRQGINPVAALSSEVSNQLNILSQTPPPSDVRSRSTSENMLTELEDGQCNSNVQTTSFISYISKNGCELNDDPVLQPTTTNEKCSSNEAKPPKFKSPVKQVLGKLFRRTSRPNPLKLAMPNRTCPTSPSSMELGPVGCQSISSLNNSMSLPASAEAHNADRRLNFDSSANDDVFLSTGHCATPTRLLTAATRLKKDSEAPARLIDRSLSYNSWSSGGSNLSTPTKDALKSMRFGSTTPFDSPTHSYAMKMPFGEIPNMDKLRLIMNRVEKQVLSKDYSVESNGISEALEDVGTLIGYHMTGNDSHDMDDDELGSVDNAHVASETPQQRDADSCDSNNNNIRFEEVKSGLGSAANQFLDSSRHLWESVVHKPAALSCSITQTVRCFIVLLARCRCAFSTFGHRQESQLAEDLRRVGDDFTGFLAVTSKFNNERPAISKPTAIELIKQFQKLTSCIKQLVSTSLQIECEKAYF